MLTPFVGMRLGYGYVRRLSAPHPTVRQLEKVMNVMKVMNCVEN
jgi:hypothetical protein